MGEFEKAIADYAAALELDPDDAFALRERGVAYLGQGKLEEALADLDLRFGALILDARSFLPQSRPRVFVVAVDASLDVNDILVLKTSYDLHDSMRFSDIREELIAKAFAL